MRRTTAVGAFCFLAFLVLVTSGRDVVRAQQVAVWAPKPAQVPGWVAPQRPHVKLSDLKARHRNQPEWRELLVDDGHLQAEYISAPPGPTLSKRFHSDSRAFWVVVDGQMRVEIEGQGPFVATKGSLVQVPKQTIRYAFENHDVFIAEAGDVAYVPASRFHLARFYGEGPSCRLAIVRNPNNTPLVEPEGTPCNVAL